MFCDMVALKDFLYIGETAKDINKYWDVADLKKIKDECNAIGLNPIELTSKENIEMLRNALPEY